MPPRGDMLPFEVEALVLDPTSQSPVLLLRTVAQTPPGDDASSGESGGEADVPQPLPIWIGIAEAAAIQAALEGRRPARPMTHDLLAAAIRQLEGELVGAIIHLLEKGTFHASLRILQGERLVDVDARASDAVALALRCGAEILVHRSVLEAIESGRGAPGQPDELPELSNLDPDAFGEYEM